MYDIFLLWSTKQINNWTPLSPFFLNIFCVCVFHRRKKRKSYRFEWVNDDLCFFCLFFEWTIPLKIRYMVNRFSVIYNQAQNTEQSVVNLVYLRWIREHFSLTYRPSVPSGLLSQRKMMKGMKIRNNEKQKNKRATAQKSQHKLFLLCCYTAYCSTTSETRRERKGKRGEEERDPDKDMPIPPKRIMLEERIANERLDDRVPAEKINEEFRKSVDFLLNIREKDC